VNLRGWQISLLLAAMLLLPEIALAQSSGEAPKIAISIADTTMGSDGSITSVMKLVIILTALTFAPALILTATCFTRIAVVLGMTRTALGTQSLPPNMVITGLALFLTFAVMGPVFQKMYDQGVKPYMDGQMTEDEAYRKTIEPLKHFLIKNSREKDIALFLDISGAEPPDDVADVPLYVAVPAFTLSELNTAFQIGFLIALPFLVLDMVVSSLLTTMSMITLPPVVISLPLKLMLFVLVDGWHLIIHSLVQTYHVT
jgi:flagellar biosynthetic protein FliP